MATENLGGPALRTFINIAKRWELSEDEQLRILGLESPSTLQSWTQKASQHELVQLDLQTLERISYVISIYRSINVLLPSPERADAWMRTQNAAFRGKSALDRMTSGQVMDLLEVHEYLKAQLV